MRSRDAGERRPDARLAPALRRGRRSPGERDVGTLPGAQQHALAGGADGDGAARNEHAERVVARTGEEAGTAYRNEAEGAADLQRRLRIRARTIEQQRAGLKADLAAGINQIAVDHQLGTFAELE